MVIVMHLNAKMHYVKNNADLESVKKQASFEACFFLLLSLAIKGDIRTCM